MSGLPSYNDPSVRITRVQLPRYFCVFAIDGPTFVRKRGSFWEPQDELGRRAESRIGVVLINCNGPADADHVRGLLDAAGFVAGTDFGVGNDTQGVLVACRGIRFSLDRTNRLGMGLLIVRGRYQRWEPEPKPKHLRQQDRARAEEAEAARFALYQRIAAFVEVDAAAIAKATEAPTHDERVQRLLEAMRKPAG